MDLGAVSLTVDNSEASTDFLISVSLACLFTVPTAEWSKNTRNSSAGDLEEANDILI